MTEVGYRRYSAARLSCRLISTRTFRHTRIDEHGVARQGPDPWVIGVLLLSPDTLIIRLVDTDPWTFIAWRGGLMTVGMFVILVGRFGLATDARMRADNNVLALRDGSAGRACTTNQDGGPISAPQARKFSNPEPGLAAANCAAISWLA